MTAITEFSIAIQKRVGRQRLRKGILGRAKVAIIGTIGAAGFTVQLYGQDGQNVVEAVNEETGETFVVCGDDLYLVVVELAQQCGIELEDG